MCDRDRSAGCNLLLEERHDTTVAAQHIAESCGDELRYRLVRSGELAEERLDIDLRDALRCSHDVRRVDGFVGTNHHKALSAVLDSEVGHVLRTEHISQNSLRGVLLHKGHMFVCSSVEDELRMVLLKHFA